MALIAHLGKNTGIVLVCAAGMLVFISVVSFLVGSSSVSLPEFIALISGGDISDKAKNILVNVRAPRVLAGVLAGSALAVAGAIIQAALDNPLASPNIIGVNAGAGLFVLLAASLFSSVVWLIPFAAFIGAFMSALIVFGIAVGGGMSRLSVVLAGIAITSVFTAGMNTILIVDPDAYINSSVFLVGGLSGVLLSDLLWPAVYTIIGMAAALLLSEELNILTLGDQSAHSLGMRVNATRLFMLGLAALLAGSAVSFAGLLGFVGLVVPHMVRFFVGYDNRIVVPLSALIGAAFVVLCDTCSRILFAPYELPVGIVMAFIGGPFFIYLIFRNRRRAL